MEINFENYLQEQFMEDEPQVLDDDIPDAFDAWLETKDVNDIMEYGEKYDKKIKKDILIFIYKHQNDMISPGTILIRLKTKLEKV